MGNVSKTEPNLFPTSIKRAVLRPDCGLTRINGRMNDLVEGRDDGVAGGVHGIAVKVSTGLPGDEDGGLPHEGEHILDTLNTRILCQRNLLTAACPLRKPAQRRASYTSISSMICFCFCFLMTLVYLTEARAVVLGGGLGHEADARGITDLGDTEPGGGVATSLLVGSGPDGEGEEDPQADNLPHHHPQNSVTKAVCAFQVPGPPDTAHYPSHAQRCCFGRPATAAGPSIRHRKDALISATFL